MPKTRKKSSMVTTERLSPNRNKPRNSTIRGSTPHHMAGNLAVETALGLIKVTTYDPVNGMSMGYAIGSDGRVGLAVEETNRAWTSSSAVNDNRCITTEIVNNGGAPDWRMSDAAINAWLDLTVEQCRFYEFKKVNYQTKPADITPAKVEAWIKTWAKDDEWIITLHNWFKATVCPGPYFTRQIPWLVREMNKRLSDENYVPEAFVGEGNTATGQSIPIPAPSQPSTPPVSLKPVDTIAKEVINGTWGNGQARIDNLTKAGYNAAEVQAKVTEMLDKSSVSLKPIPAPSQPPTPLTAFKPYEVAIATNAINVRKGPGIDQIVVKTLVNDKNVYTIIEEKDGPAGNGSIGKWGKLKSDIGWLLLVYTRKK